MISPQYSWAYGRLTKEISDKLKENHRGSLVVKVGSDLGSIGIISDFVGYKITIYDKGQSLGEIEVSNRESVRVSFDKTLEDISKS